LTADVPGELEALVDVPKKKEFVKGEYDVPVDAGDIRIKITDLLSESLEMDVSRG
jgi:site-specific DNA-methyltransferase (adenine-specific)